jgi:hypothetical protein
MLSPEQLQLEPTPQLGQYLLLPIPLQRGMLKMLEAPVRWKNFVEHMQMFRRMKQCRPLTEGQNRRQFDQQPLCNLRSKYVK